MSDNWKTLRVPKDAWQEAKAQKEEHNRTWGEQLVCSNDATTEREVVVDNDALYEARDEILGAISAECGDVATTEDMKEVAAKLSETASVVEELLQQEPSNSEVVVENVEMQAENGGVTADDVETIVENWLEKNADKLRKGEI